MGVVDPGGGTSPGSYYEILGEDHRTMGKRRRKMRGDRMVLEETRDMEEIFMVVESDTLGKSLATYNPFLFQKAVELAITGKPISTTLLRDGKILMKMRNSNDANKLKKINLNHPNATMKVKVYEHESLNLTKGMVRCDACMFLTEEELLDGLKSQKVTKVEIMKRKNDKGILVNTRSAILTFNCTVLPRKVDIGYFTERVELYIPKPTRCMNCMRIGHTKKVCYKEKKCAKCSEEFHEVCKNSAKCAECGGAHGTLDKECPVYKDECEIKKIQTENRVTMREARRIRRNIVPVIPRNYTSLDYATTTANKSREITQSPQTNSSNQNQPKPQENRIINNIEQSQKKTKPITENSKDTENNNLTTTVNTETQRKTINTPLETPITISSDDEGSTSSTNTAPSTHSGDKIDIDMENVKITLDNGETVPYKALTKEEQKAVTANRLLEII